MKKRKMLTLLLVLSLVITMMPFSTASAKKKVSLSEKKLTLRVKESETIFLYNNKKKVKWSTSNKKVVSISHKRKDMVDLKAKKKGKATITAKIGKKRYKCKVAVKAKTSTSVTPTTVKLSQSSAIVNIGASVSLSVMVNPSSESSKVKWSSSNEKVATVNSGIVTGVSAGAATITATVNGLSATCAIQVNQTYGSVSGNITYFYNDFKGNVPDTGADVLLISKNGTAKEVPNFSSYIEWEIESNINRYNDKGMYFAEVDGTGAYHFNNIPVGEYKIFITSNKTTSGYGFEHYEIGVGFDDTFLNVVASNISGYVSDYNAKLIGQCVGLNKYTANSISVKANQSTIFSYDFGITYI